MIKNVFKAIIGLISAYIIYNLFSSFDYSYLISFTVTEILFIGLIPVLVLCCCIFYLKLTLNSFGFNPARNQLIFLFASGHVIGRLTFSVIGSVSKIHILKEILNTNYHKALLIFFAESLVSYSIIIVLATIGIILFIKNINLNLSHLIIVSCLFLLCILLILFVYKRTNFFNRMFRGSLSTKIKELIDNTKEIVGSTDKYKLLFALIANFLILLLHTFMLWLILLHYGYHSNISLLLCIRSISVLAGVLSLIPDGIGPKDLTTYALLLPIGIDHNAAFSSVLLHRLFTTAISLSISVILLNFTLKGNISKLNP